MRLAPLPIPPPSHLFSCIDPHSRSSTALACKPACAMGPFMHHPPPRTCRPQTAHFRTPIPPPRTTHMTTSVPIPLDPSLCPCAHAATLQPPQPFVPPDPRPPPPLCHAPSVMPTRPPPPPFIADDHYGPPRCALLLTPQVFLPLAHLSAGGPLPQPDPETTSSTHYPRRQP
jgi:hypothetical protein